MTRRGWYLARVSIILTLLLAAGTAPDAPTDPSDPPPPPPANAGDRLLARAVAAPGLTSYTVPLSFGVHVTKPIRVRTKLGGTAYFRAPGQAVLAITSGGGMAGRFFRGVYHLDVIPQAWPAVYHVVAVSRSVYEGVPVLVLHAQPRTPSADLAQVLFTLSTPELRPLAAEWQFHNGSSIRCTFVMGHSGEYALPQSATIAVDVPRFRLEADATYANYNLNAPVPATMFAAAK